MKKNQISVDEQCALQLLDDTIDKLRCCYCSPPPSSKLATHLYMYSNYFLTYQIQMCSAHIFIKIITCICLCCTLLEIKQFSKFDGVFLCSTKYFHRVLLPSNMKQMLGSVQAPKFVNRLTHSVKCEDQTHALSI